MKILRILVPTDFSPSSERAVEIAIDLAKRYTAELTLLHVYEIPVYSYSGEFGAISADAFNVAREAAAKQLDRAVVEVRKELPSATGALAVGSPWQEIERAIAEERADLVVMGTHGRRNFARLLMGSVAEKIVRISPVPVMTVPTERKAEAPAAKP